MYAREEQLLKSSAAANVCHSLSNLDHLMKNLEQAIMHVMKDVDAKKSVSQFSCCINHSLSRDDILMPYKIP